MSDKPSAAFKEKWHVKYGDLANPTAIFRLDSRLHGFSMVVASSNNGAVENVTRELPNVAKIAAHFRDDTNDLKTLATQLLNLSIASDDGDAGAEADQQRDTRPAQTLRRRRQITLDEMGTRSGVG